MYRLKVMPLFAIIDILDYNPITPLYRLYFCVDWEVYGSTGHNYSYKE